MSNNIADCVFGAITSLMVADSLLETVRELGGASRNNRYSEVVLLTLLVAKHCDYIATCLTQVRASFLEINPETNNDIGAGL